MTQPPFSAALADAGVEDRGLEARVGADEHDGIGFLDAGNAGVEEIAGAAALLAQRRAILAAIDVLDAQRGCQLLPGEGFLGADEIAENNAHAFGLCRLHLLGNPAEGLGPGGGAQLAELADIGLVKALGFQAVPDKAGLVGNPFLVHVLVGARQDAHDFASHGHQRGCWSPRRPWHQSYRSCAVPKAGP